MMNGSALGEFHFPDDRYEIRLSGSGGQGLVLAAMLLAEAVGADPAKRVIQTKSYGPEARGGASKSDVVISTSDIYYPKAYKLDLLLAMTQESLDKYYRDLKEHGTLIVDDTLVSQVPCEEYYALSFTQFAQEQLHNVMVANVIALGSIAAITSVVSLKALMKVVLARAPRGTEEINRAALEMGFHEGMLLRQESEGFCIAA